MRRSISSFSVWGTFLLVLLGTGLMAAETKTNSAVKKNTSKPAPIASVESKNSAEKTAPSEALSKKPLSVEDRAFLKKTIELCSALKKDRLSAKPKDPAIAIKEIKAIIAKLKNDISEISDDANAGQWISYLELNELEKGLSAATPNSDACRSSLKALESKEPGLEYPIFDPLRNILKSFIADQGKVWDKQELDDFRYVCDQLPRYLENLLRRYDVDMAELVTISLAYLRESAIKQQTYDQLEKIVLKYFSSPNLTIVFSDNFLRKENKQKIKEDIEVSEYIRSSQVIGNGTVDGTISSKFVPNKEKAEINIEIKAIVKTQTSAYQNGVQVKSDNVANIDAKKAIYFTDYLTTAPAAVTGQMDSNITGIFSERSMGWNIIQQRVAEEQPYSKAESQQRMEQRFSDRLNNEVDTQLAPSQKYLDQKFYKFLREIDFVPRAIKSSSTNKNIFWTALLASKTQPGLPMEKTAKVDKKASDADIEIALHASALNNAFFNSFSGQRVSDQNIAKRLSDVFSPTDAKPATQEKKNTDSPLWLIFAEDQPMTVLFDKDQVKTIMRLNAFEKDEKDYPELTIEIIYQLEKNNDGFIARRKVLDARPGDLAPGQIIPARYQAIRTLVLDKLGSSLKESLEVKPIDPAKIRQERMKKEAVAQKENESAEKEKKSKNRAGMRPGVFVPTFCGTENDWLTLKYKFVPSPEPKQK